MPSGIGPSWGCEDTCGQRGHGRDSDPAPVDGGTAASSGCTRNLSLSGPDHALSTEAHGAGRSPESENENQPTTERATRWLPTAPLHALRILIDHVWATAVEELQ